MRVKITQISLLLSFLFFGLVGVLTAKSIDSNLAKEIAKNFYWEKASQLNNTKYNDILLKHVYTRIENNVDVYYINA